MKSNMKQVIGIAWALVLAGGVCHAQADPSLEVQKEALRDWEALGKLAKEVSKSIHAYTPNGPYGGTIREKHDERLAFIEGYQLQTQPAVESQLAAFEAKYGGTHQAVLARYEEIYPSRSGYRLPKEIEAEFNQVSMNTPTPDRLLRETRAELAGLQKTRVESADGLATQAKPSIGLLETTRPDQLANSLNQLERNLRFAVRYDPKNEEARTLLADVEKRIAASAEILAGWLDSRKFPSATTNFAGPGDAGELAASCLEWFQKSPEWGGGHEHPITVVTTGDWTTTRRNIWGVPVQWGLPIYLAIWRDADPEIARVFSLTMITATAVDVAKSPPWSGCLVGSSFPMRRSNVPGGGDVASGSSGGSSSSGEAASGGASVMGILGSLCCCVFVLVAAGGVGFVVYRKSQAAGAASEGPPAA